MEKSPDTLTTTYSRNPPTIVPIAIDVPGLLPRPKTLEKCDSERVLLRINRTTMQLFLSAVPFEMFANDLPGEFLTPKCGKCFLVVIMDRFSMLNMTVQLKLIAAHGLVRALSIHWVLTYGLSDTGKQFTSRFSQHVGRILGNDNFFATTYHAQCNAKFQWSNVTILAGFRHYIADHPKDWYMYTHMLRNYYNTHVNSITICTTFVLAL